jgi:hypothetical protein
LGADIAIGAIFALLPLVFKTENQGSFVKLLQVYLKTIQQFVLLKSKNLRNGKKRVKMSSYSYKFGGFIRFFALIAVEKTGQKRFIWHLSKKYLFSLRSLLHQAF